MWSTELLAARLVLGSVFLVAGIGKLSSSRVQLVDAMMNYRLLTYHQVRIIAPFLPFGELALAVLCIAGIGLPIVVGFMVFLLLVFTGAIVINLVWGRRFSCHCFGRSNTMIGPTVVVRNSILLAIAIFVVIQSLPFVGIAATFALWRTDVRLLTRIETVAPLLAVVALALGVLMLLDGIDVVLSQASTDTRRN